MLGSSNQQNTIMQIHICVAKHHSLADSSQLLENNKIFGSRPKTNLIIKLIDSLDQEGPIYIKFGN